MRTSPIIKVKNVKDLLKWTRERKRIIRNVTHTLLISPEFRINDLCKAAGKGDLDLVKNILSENNTLLNQKNYGQGFLSSLVYLLKIK